MLAWRDCGLRTNAPHFFYTQLAMAIFRFNSWIYVTFFKDGTRRTGWDQMQSYSLRTEFFSR